MDKTTKYLPSHCSANSSKRQVLAAMRAASGERHDSAGGVGLGVGKEAPQTTWSGALGGGGASAAPRPSHARMRSASSSCETRLTNVASTAASSLPQRGIFDPGLITVDLSGCRYDVIYFVLYHMLGFHVSRLESTSSQTLLVWSDVSIAPKRIHALCSRKVLCNHFPNIEQLCRKLPMSKLLMRMQDQFPELYSFFPKTFGSYAEYSARMSGSSGLEANGRTAFFICKPNGGCQGKNIFLTDHVTPHVFEGIVKNTAVFNGSPAAVASGNGQAFVVQQYLDRPLCVLNRKNDLRCYVLVTSVQPLTVYFHREGIVRICRDEYEFPSPANCDNAQMHLANYAVNKKCSAAEGPSVLGTAPAPMADLKWSFAHYTKYITQLVQHDDRLMARAREAWTADSSNAEAVAEGRTPPMVLLAATLVEDLWRQIQMVCLKSVLAAQHSIVPHMRFAETSLSEIPPLPAQLSAAKPQLGPCFELLGFDIMVDADLKPWLIEINHSPSWFTDTTFDFELKRRVIRDALQLTLIPHIKRHQSRPGGGFPQRCGSSVGGFRRSTEGEAEQLAAERQLYAQEMEEEGNGFLLLSPKKATYDELRQPFKFQSCSRR
jgi:tubulin polyglutamylase TTLL6/13